MSFLKTGFGKVARNAKFQYEPRYTDENTREETREERIKFEKGSLLKSVNTLSKHRAPIFSHKEKLSTQKKWRLLILLTALIGDTYYLFTHMQKGWSHIVFPLLFLLVLLILFIHTNNQR